MHWRRVLVHKHYKRWRDNSVVLVTGASSGIGKELALRYAARRCRLVLAARSIAELEEVAAECRRRHSETQAVTVQCDVSVEEDCKRLVDFAVEQFGGIDILVLNAGIGCHNRFSATDDLSVYRRLMEVNFFGYLHCTKYAFAHLVRSRGVLLAVSSMSGEMGLPYRTAYCASKFAVTGFFEALRSEMSLHPDDSFDIVIVCPPTVRGTNLRTHALTDRTSDAQAHSLSASLSPVDNSKSSVSLKECVDVIIDAVDRRYRKVYFPLSAYVGVYLRPFVPDAIDYFVRQRAKL